MTANLFQIGDRVTMNEYGMSTYGPTACNPHHMKGGIVEKTLHNYKVLWDNGYKNTYKDNHLESVEDKVTFRSFMRKLDERDTLPKVQRVRTRSKTGLKKSATVNPYSSLADSLGVAPSITAFASTITTSSPQPLYSLEQDVEQEDFSEFDEIDWDSDPDEYYGEVPESGEAF
jgi:hypothetical protein